LKSSESESLFQFEFSFIFRIPLLRDIGYRICGLLTIILS